MFKKHRQDCEHPKISNLIYIQQLQISLTNFDEILQKFDNYVTNPTAKKNFRKIKATQEN